MFKNTTKVIKCSPSHKMSFHVTSNTSVKDFRHFFCFCLPASCLTSKHKGTYYRKNMSIYVLPFICLSHAGHSLVSYLCVFFLYNTFNDTFFSVFCERIDKKIYKIDGKMSAWFSGEWTNVSGFCIELQDPRTITNLTGIVLLLKMFCGRVGGVWRRWVWVR